MEWGVSIVLMCNANVVVFLVRLRLVCCSVLMVLWLVFLLGWNVRIMLWWVGLLIRMCVVLRSIVMCRLWL